MDVGVEIQKHVCIILKVLKRLRCHRSSSLTRLHCVSSRPQSNDGWTVRSKRMHSHLSQSALGRHHQRDARRREFAVSCWIILEPAAHVCVLAGLPRYTRAPCREGVDQLLVHDTQITGHQISQPVKSYSFETQGASMIYERREFFKGWSTESHSMTSEAKNNLGPLHRSIPLACDRYHGCLQI